MVKNSYKFFSLLFYPEFVFIILFMFLATISAVFLPVGVGADEPSHIARVEQIGNGELVSHQVDRKNVDWDYSDNNHGTDQLWGGESDYALVSVTVNNMRDYQLGKDTYTFPTWNTERIKTETRYGEKKVVFVFSNSAVNSPIAYIPQVIGYKLSSMITDNVWIIIIVMRLSGVIALGVGIFFCIRYIPIGKWSVAAIGLLPVVILADSMVTADSMTLLCCVVFITSVICAMCAKDGNVSRANNIILSCSGCLLGLVKLVYFPLIILMWLIPLWNNKVRNTKVYMFMWGIFVTGLIVLLIWYHNISSINTGAMFSALISPSLQKQFILEHPLLYMKKLFISLIGQNILQVGDYGPLTAHGSAYGGGWINVLLLMISLIASDRREVNFNKRSSNYIFAFLVSNIIIFMIVFTLVATALYLQFSGVGDDEISGIQSRYFIPIMVLLILSLVTTKNWLSNDDGTLFKMRLVHASIVVLSFLSCICILIDIFHVLYAWI